MQRLTRTHPSGIRPLVKDPHAKNTESLVRSHLVTVSPSGLLTCAGGKWTTFRQMAEEAVDEAIKTFDLKPKPVDLPDISGAGIPSLTTDGTCQTRFVRLTGSHGFTEDLDSQVAETHKIDPDIIHHLTHNYGDRVWAVLGAGAPASSTNRLVAQLPFIEAEVLYSTRAEAACTAIDVISRRMRLSFLDVNGALAALPRIIDLMADELKWDAARRDQEWADTVQFLGSMGLERGRTLLGRDEITKEVSRDLSHEGGRISTVQTQGAM